MRDVRSADVPGPLAGFSVLDLSAIVSGPLTAALLADQGASVIKVERLVGDIQRHVGSSRNGFSGFFHVINRGKRSIALDLGTDEGRGIVERLAKRADVVMQNFRPGVISRLGLGYETLSALNPKLVYLSISGFGQTGPRAGERAYDPIIQFYSGHRGDAGPHPPRTSGSAGAGQSADSRQADRIHGLPGDHGGVARALEERRRPTHRTVDARYRDRVPVARHRGRPDPAR